MKTIVMDGPRKSHVEEAPMPVINDDQLLVKLTYTGACHSEWYPWTTASNGERFGHEPMGVVAEVGKNVKGFKVGDRVTGMGGGFCEYIPMNPKNTVHIPDNISDEDAAATEALACLLSAVSKMPLRIPGDPVAVVGAGYMGLGAISLFKLKGAGRIIAVDPREEARQNALKFGATEVYAPDELPFGYKLDWKTWGSADLTRSGESVDIFKTGFRNVMEFTGTESGLRLAGEMVSAHGLLCIGGYHNDFDRKIDFKLWNMKAMTVINAHERREDYMVQCCKNALDMLSTGQWNFKNVCTVYSMDEFDKVNQDMESKPKGFIKGIIKC